MFKLCTFSHYISTLLSSATIPNLYFSKSTQEWTLKTMTQRCCWPGNSSICLCHHLRIAVFVPPPSLYKREHFLWKNKIKEYVYNGISVPSKITSNKLWVIEDFILLLASWKQTPQLPTPYHPTPYHKIYLLIFYTYT